MDRFGPAIAFDVHRLLKQIPPHLRFLGVTPLDRLQPVTARGSRCSCRKWSPYHRDQCHLRRRSAHTSNHSVIHSADPQVRTYIFNLTNPASGIQHDRSHVRRHLRCTSAVRSPIQVLTRQIRYRQATLQLGLEHHNPYPLLFQARAEPFFGT